MRIEYIAKIPLNGESLKKYEIIPFAENDFIIDGKVGHYKTVEEAQEFIESYHKSVNEFLESINSKIRG